MKYCLSNKTKWIILLLLAVSLSAFGDFTPQSPNFPHGLGIIRSAGGCNTSDNACPNGLNFPSFNNFIDSGLGIGINDERRFLVVSNLGPNGKNTNSQYEDSISVNIGDLIYVRAYVHNNGHGKDSKTTANNVKIGISNFNNNGNNFYYSSSGTAVIITQFISSDNTTPKTVTDSAEVISATGKPIKLLYVAQEKAVQTVATISGTLHSIDPLKFINQGGDNISSVKGCSEESFYTWTIFRVVDAAPIATNNIFDGAGSIISPAEDCYGCDKDTAVMQPHQGDVSTVVFQWRQSNSCSALAINSDSSLPVIISAKTWKSPSIEKKYKATISENNFFSLGSLGKWTTFSLTSTLPITKPIRIDAKCADATNVSSQQVKTSDVVVDSGAKWMGTGSIISQAQQGDVNGYGVLKDVSIGSQNTTALTSFQWYASPSCSKLTIGEGTNINATISKKLWDEASFSQVCTTLPCNINGVSGKYYVVKIESNAGTFPISDGNLGGMISAVCH